MKKLILLFLLIILSLNITGCFNNTAILDKPKSSASATVKCINKAWYKKHKLCNSFLGKRLFVNHNIHVL
ncbi:hypothetical protein BK764_14495 [Bacillus thuringiensis serovar israelensis]|nr:putative lipoprotein [Bacillus thuringiensis HD1002]OTX59518.1 hypothetical protein BK719_30630 [Bacillus thuringiensis serovar novosibirsk]OTZ56625.1 hypothetical protein BK764_14495 [Bacillus thuringiensis serovar israelensis]